MRPRHALAAAVLLILLAGALRLAHPSSTLSVEPLAPEVAFGKLSPGSTVGLNATNASGSVAGSLSVITTNVLYLNNTNASGAYFARLVTYSSSGVSNVVTLEIGLDNGTRTPQVTGSLGSLSETSGSYVRLEPASTNHVYIKQTVTSLLAADTVINLDVYVADDAAESAFYKMRATVRVT